MLTRSYRLNWLGGETPGQCRVLSNARCLTEGIDVPALDAVLFLQPRKSQIDVVQAVGRIMRKVEGKQFGYVILPIVIPPDQDPETALARNAAYIHVWEVLQALRSHDERFDAHVNQIDLRKKRDEVIKVIGVGFEGDEQDEENDQAIGVAAIDTPYVQPTMDFEPWADAIYARIVQNVGDRRYWDRWAQSVTGIAATHETRIRALIDSPTAGVRAEFGNFADALRENLNDSITNSDAVTMLSQHMITRPVFEDLFASRAFTQHNPVSQVMQRMVETLEGRGLEAETADLQEFYASVRRRIEGIDTTAGRQQVIRDLYESFFRLAFPKDARALGVVYTPVEIVDFIIRSVETLLRREFDASLSDPEVHILDPFVGTGMFITRLMESGYIQPHDLARKYTKEMHANEYLLLAYYIAAVNIETTFESLHRETKLPADGADAAHQPFPGIVLTDTFQLPENENRLPLDVFPRNSRRAERQLELRDIRVIIGNPPWSASQRSQNDNNPNVPYPTLDKSIAVTYAKRSRAKLMQGLYDSYIRAIRWASNRLGDSKYGGVIGLVTNGSYIDGKSFDGLRKTVAAEFHSIYCYNLRGNTRGTGDWVQREGGKVFGQGSRATVAILLLVKHPRPVTSPPIIHYLDIGDYLTREEKLALVDDATLDNLDWTDITPDERGDWINQQSPKFPLLRPLMQSRRSRDTSKQKPLFETGSYGLNSGRDPWVYNSSGAKLRANIVRALDFFNNQTNAADVAADIDRDPKKFSWDSKTELRVSRGRTLALDSTGFRTAVYRPFFRQRVYMEAGMNARPGLHPSLFPAGSDNSNFGIFVANTSSTRHAVSALAVDSIPDLHLINPDGRFYPRYNYGVSSRGSQGILIPETDLEHARSDNMSPDSVAGYRARYGPDVSTDDIFAYVYGVLHSPDYRQRYETDLSKEPPRIPEVSSSDLFHAFSQAGARLIGLHLNYETATPYDLVEERRMSSYVKDTEVYRVEQMRFAGPRQKPDRSTLVFNDYVTLHGIPPEAHEYVIGSRSALGWLMDRYEVKTDSDSTIVNDPNDWATEHGNPRYILDLVKRIVTVSLETVRIVRNLPPLDEAP